jgi:hypothetical protein
LQCTGHLGRIRNEKRRCRLDRFWNDGKSPSIKPDADLFRNAVWPLRNNWRFFPLEIGEPLPTFAERSGLGAGVVELAAECDPAVLSAGRL